MRRGAARAAGAAVGLAVSTLTYYALRGLGVGVHPALVASAAVSALPALASLARHRRVDGLSTYVTAMTLGALVVSLLPGSRRFLLAREAVVTGVTGIWFLAGVRAHRPLVYLVSRPLLEGRLHWPPDWEALWAASPRFRRMWHTSSVLWGSGLLADAGVRVLLAYTVPPDRVPALGAALFGATAVVVNLATHAHYASCGVHDPRSPLRRAGDAARARPGDGTSAATT